MRDFDWAAIEHGEGGVVRGESGNAVGESFGICGNHRDGSTEGFRHGAGEIEGQRNQADGQFDKAAGFHMGEKLVGLGLAGGIPRLAVYSVDLCA